MKKYWDSIKLFTWAFGLLFGFTLMVIILESADTSAGTDINKVNMLNTLFSVVSLVCLLLIILGTYRFLKIYFHKPAVKAKKKSNRK